MSTGSGGARGALVVVVAGLAAAGCGTQGAAGAVRPGPDPTVRAGRMPTAPGAAPTADRPPVCPGSGVRASADVPDAAMGLRAVAVHAVNCGTRPRTLSGYPGVRVLDEARTPLAVAVHRGSSSTTGIADPAPTRLVLAPGDTAVAVLVWRNTVTDATVPAATGAFLTVTTTADATPQQVPLEVDLGNTGKLDVTAWHRESPADGPNPDGSRDITERPGAAAGSSR
jgi:Protein of unknown function (DUF4232)